jgi:glycyl-tRNA synthetase beta chain
MTLPADLLIELGTEELPPKALLTLSNHFQTEVLRRLTQAGLQCGPCRAFATPRRLALLIEQVPARQPDQQIERRGPAVTAAFDALGAPTGAALGFARSCGVEMAALERQATDKGEWLTFRSLVPGLALAALLPGMVEDALAALPIPKRMRWGSADYQFVRPVQWLVLLHGTQVIPAEIFGVRSGAISRGHRYMGAASIPLAVPGDYEQLLATSGRVIVDFAARRERVRALVTQAGVDAGGCPLIDPQLLDEVTALVEWPCAITGSFDAHFLAVPREALIASMQGHQKYFPLEDATGQLLNQFVTIANIDSPQPELIRSGNERVIRPRLSDAVFFWNKDRATPLATRLARLADMVFERRLGSLLEKSERVAVLAGQLAPLFNVLAEHPARAALLSRCDLICEMVGEFPELQGTMGAYYAAHDGEPPAVVAALREFYQPRYAGDAIPASPSGQCLAIADKLDTLTGIFGVGGAPTGDKDPYALRRAALGCLRICMETDSPIDLLAGLNAAAAGHAERIAAGTPLAVFDFMLERARGYFHERGSRADVVESVLVTRPTQPRELRRRILAVEAFLQLPAALSLAAANKRISNILRKAPDFTPGQPDPALLVEPAELALARELALASQETAELASSGDYAGYLARAAALHAPVDAFFEEVLVMAEDDALRRNRLQLLSALQALFLRVADISHIAAT